MTGSVQRTCNAVLRCCRPLTAIARPVARSPSLIVCLPLWILLRTAPSTTQKVPVGAEAHVGRALRRSQHQPRNTLGIPIPAAPGPLKPPIPLEFQSSRQPCIPAAPPHPYSPPPLQPCPCSPTTPPHPHTPAAPTPLQPPHPCSPPPLHPHTPSPVRKVPSGQDPTSPTHVVPSQRCSHVCSVDRQPSFAVPFPVWSTHMLAGGWIVSHPTAATGRESACDR